MSSFVLGLAVICIVLAISAVETGPNRSRELSLVAALAAAAAGGRVLFAFVPNVQPVTIIVAVTGATLGARAGIAAGGAAALLSNTVLGQGPWTAWQMIGWGLVGATAAPLGRLLRNRWALAAFGIVWGFLFDWLMDVWAWSSLGPSADLHSFIALAATGLPFDIAHATGNAIIAVVAGPSLIRMLDRYAQRLHATFSPLETT
ncbi:MAG: energy-coupling factor transport system substrate-specific component [Gaiellales bacterium]|jgi:energy-coupling factor transport system substrate-specific component|nr:energy-coupling factor transport system substrate-specific component [Gaiellales bacterium]